MLTTVRMTHNVPELCHARLTLKVFFFFYVINGLNSKCRHNAEIIRQSSVMLIKK